MKKVLIKTEEIMTVTYIMEVPNDATVEDAEDSLWRGVAEEFDSSTVSNGIVEANFITKEEMMRLHKLTRMGKAKWDSGTVEEILVNPWRGSGAYRSTK
jgi:hypothetical protein